MDPRRARWRVGSGRGAAVSPRYTDIVATLPTTVPFFGPEALERTRGAPFRARLGANENAFGPSPRALAALREAAPDVWMYGDPECHALRAALAAKHGVGIAHVVVGEGIDGLLQLIVRLMVAPGDVAVTSEGAYPTFNYHVAGAGGVLIKVPYAGDQEDPERLARAARAHGAKLVYLANPDNPMGSWLPGTVIIEMLEALPQGTLLVLDEAYAEFSPAGTCPALDPFDERVIRLRTFSKAYGLAALRVGYGIAHPGLIRACDKLRNHFGVGRLAQAGALAALADQDWLAETIAKVEQARARIAEIGALCGLSALPSATNFVTLDCGRDGAFARAILAEAQKRGLFIRMPFVAPHDRCIRITAAPDPALDVLAELLPEAVAAARRREPA